MRSFPDPTPVEAHLFPPSSSLVRFPSPQHSYRAPRNPSPRFLPPAPTFTRTLEPANCASHGGRPARLGSHYIGRRLSWLSMLLSAALRDVSPTMSEIRMPGRLAMPGAFGGGVRPSPLAGSGWRVVAPLA